MADTDTGELNVGVTTGLCRAAVEVGKQWKEEIEALEAIAVLTDEEKGRQERGESLKCLTGNRLNDDITNQCG